MDATPDAPRSAAGDATSTADLIEEARASAMQRLNAAVPGTVTLHYKARDIRVDVVGDAALRMMTWFRRGRAEGLADALDPRTTSSLDPWITMGRKGLLAITWDPGPDADVAVPKDVLVLLEQIEILQAAAAPAGTASRVGIGDAQAQRHQADDSATSPVRTDDAKSQHSTDSAARADES